MTKTASSLAFRRTRHLGAHDANRDTSTGAAYVFVRDASGKWSQQVWLKAINTRKNDQFGESITISGDGNTIAVGSIFGAGAGGSKGVNADPNDDSLSGTGSVYIFTRSGNTWTPGAYVKAPNARTSAEFGKSVALSADGKTLAVGSFYETSAAKGLNGNRPTRLRRKRARLIFFTEAHFTSRCVLKGVDDK